MFSSQMRNFFLLNKVMVDFLPAGLALTLLLGAFGNALAATVLAVDGMYPPTVNSVTLSPAKDGQTVVELIANISFWTKCNPGNVVSEYTGTEHQSGALIFTLKTACSPLPSDTMGSERLMVTVNADLGMVRSSVKTVFINGKEFVVGPN